MRKVLSAVLVLTVGLILSTASFAGEKNSKVVKIKGMMCTSCANKVEQALQKVDGVKSVQADYKTGEVKIVFSSDKINLKKVNDAISGTGFQAVSYDGKSACELGICTSKDHKPAKAKKDKAKKS
ncbi:MAG TPA: heavy-metal-associated domain-containing protein [Bacteroidetes bacterium]|nr:heavy-metal-associated domain-containing protein [Bacteroidota bacterium]